MSSRRVKIGSLFAGIGGLDKGIEDALRAAGFDVELAWQVEKNDFARAVLAKHWPGVNRSVTDVRAASPLVLPCVDWIVGGFPCQDLSSNGKGAGLSGARSGLWWECHRIVAAFRPTVVVVENVTSGKDRWLCPVRRSLHELGYHTTPLGISAQDVGAPHIRERIFVVAYTDNGRRQAFRDSGQLDPGERPGQRHDTDRRRGARGSPHVRRQGVEPRLDRGVDGVPAGVDADPVWSLRWPAGRGEQQHRWEPPRAAAGVPQVFERLTALGNAVMPACAEEVGRWIVQNVL